MIDIDAIRLLLNRSHLNETFQTSSQVVAAALYQVTVEGFGFLFALEVLTPGEDVDEPLERHRRHQPTAGRPALC